jgi:hypothetical protein
MRDNIQETAGVRQVRQSIVNIIGARVALRKAGREHKGLCPFHSEKTPSFTVNEDKAVFYCHGCHVGGDVFDFIMQLDGITFPEARAQLGVSSTRPTPRRHNPVKHAAGIITGWANDMTMSVNEQLREIGERRIIARLIDWREEINLLGREWTVLETLADDLQDDDLIIEIWREREAVEGLLGMEVDCGELPGGSSA